MPNTAALRARQASLFMLSGALFLCFSYVSLSQLEWLSFQKEIDPSLYTVASAFLLAVSALLHISIWRNPVPALVAEIEKLSFQWHEKNCELNSLRSFSTKFVTQDSVDRNIQALAIAFNKTCDVQAKVLAESNRDEGNKELATELASAGEDLQRKKSAFWDAVNTAKFLGFKVKGKLSDYLPEE
ncbi:MAG: hypothetical protein ISR99_02185 [Parcubacteria group bacterium]|nr:hypothetical protein [Parcubacteria group bacterium]